MTRFETVFGQKKPVIAMVHLGALPGTPLHDAAGGIHHAPEDIPAYCRMTRHELLQAEHPVYWIRARTPD